MVVQDFAFFPLHVAIGDFSGVDKAIDVPDMVNIFFKK